MNILSVSLLLPIAFCQFFEEELFFYQASRGLWHANRGDTIVTVTNPDDFGVQHGYAIAKFNCSLYDITLLNYTFIRNPDIHMKGLNLKSESTSYNDCPLFGKKVVVAVYRVQHRNNQEGCVSVETVERYFQYLDSHLRLISANRIRFDMDNSVISNVCCPCSEEECYGPNQYQVFMNKVMEGCKPLDSRLNMAPMTRLFFNDDFGGFAGLASLGQIESFTNNGNYWAINNVNNDPDEMWKWEYNLSVLVHEFGHTMGMGHAAYTEANPTYFLQDYTKPDNYGDGGNVMGSGNYWDTVISPSHYYYRLSKAKVEPFWYSTAEDVDRRTIRLFAWDHPYSRPFLGVEEPRYDDNEVIDGVSYRDNVMTLEIPYNREDMCSTISEDVRYGSFYLEYRNKKGGQQGAAHRGVRLIQGRVEKDNFDQTRSLILSAGVDGLFSWADSSIPVGVWWVPRDADLGTIGIRIRKIHTVTDWMDEALLDDPVQPLENIPYVELEYSYAPNVKYIPPNQPSPLPSFVFSPNVFGCEMNSNITGWECSVIGVNRFWAYMKPFAHRGHPRVFSLDTSSLISTASSSVVSLPSRARSGWTHFYGDTTRGRCTVKISAVDSSGSAEPWLRVQLYRKKQSEPESAYKLYHSGDAVYVRSINVEEQDEVYILDLFGHEERISVAAGTQSFMHVLPERVLPGLYEGYIMKRRGGVPVFAARFSQMVSEMKSNRLAVQILDSNQVEVSSAAIPSSRFSFPSMLFSRSLKQSERLAVMFQDWTFGDYLLVDFSGKLPRSLLFYLETDNGDIVFDLKRFSGVSDLTLKLTYRQVIAAGSVAGHIHYVWFNKGVTLLSIRPVLASNVANIQTTFNGKEEVVDDGDYRLKGTIAGFQGFEDVSYTGSLNGWRYTVSTTDANGQVVRFADQGVNISASMVVFIVVLVILFIVLVFVVRVSMKRKRKNLSSANVSSGAPPSKKSTQGASAPKRLAPTPVKKTTPPAPPVKKTTPPAPPVKNTSNPPKRSPPDLPSKTTPPDPPKRSSPPIPPPKKYGPPILPPKPAPQLPPKPAPKRSVPPPIPNKNLKPK